MRGLIAGSSRRVLDLTQPLQARQYLKLLRDDRLTGIRVRENLAVPKRRLGFSFSSNRFGLRGPHDTTAQNVVIGTSFAMGLGVDDGLNWYERCLPTRDWFNAGLPVGPIQMEALLEAYVPGRRRACLFVYHPNLWWVSGQYAKLRHDGGGAFATFGWKTGLLECMMLSYQKRQSLFVRLDSGKRVVFRFRGSQYHVDCDYSHFDFEVNAQLVDESVATIRRILHRFDRVIVVRVPVKQDLLHLLLPVQSNSQLAETIQNYEIGWDLLRQRTSDLSSIEFHKLDQFELDDFHPQDNHWNEAGNEKFATIVKQSVLPRL